MGQLHPSPSRKQSAIPANPITKGLHADTGPLRETRYVHCKQCGFVCHLDRDARGIDQFDGEVYASDVTEQEHSPLTIEDGETPLGLNLGDGSFLTTGELISGSQLFNGSFENWTGGNPDTWTVSGSVTQATLAGYFDPSDDGASALKITKTSSTISLSQSASTPSLFGGNIVTFRARVKSLVNDVVILRLTVNGVDHYSSYSIAQQRFQELSVLVNCPQTVSSLSVAILADNASGTAYVDQCKLARNGNPIVVNSVSGCPHCASFNYA